MSSVLSSLESAPSIEVELNYFAQDPKADEPPYLYINPGDVPAGKERANHVREPYPCRVRDFRGLEDHFSLDTTGFSYVKSDSLAKVGDGTKSRPEWEDDRWIQDVYYKEVEELLLSHTGAKRITFFDHTIRKQSLASAGTPDAPTPRQPAFQVHVDQTPDSARRRVVRHTGEDAEELLKGRFQIINVWRPLRGPVKDIPLALADYRTVDESADFVPTKLIYGPGEPTGETYSIKHNPQHQWYFLSDIQPDEALLIKCFDSDESLNTAKLTPHTAFVDRRYEDKVPPRESIEVRTLVFY